MRLGCIAWVERTRRIQRHQTYPLQQRPRQCSWQSFAWLPCPSRCVSTVQYSTPSDSKQLTTSNSEDILLHPSRPSSDIPSFQCFFLFHLEPFIVIP